ncbi:MAG: hypothetical protein KJO65_09120 [Gemmatimonadetes bacterium]|nr:hypothetical protein [Gemmatimonadota bacterium]
MMRLIYQLAVSALRTLTPLLAMGGGKLAKGVAGRRHADQALAAWGETLRDPERPTVWIHAPSVGEGLQARAVKEALVERRPELQVAFTHFSPSAESLASRFGSDTSSYLPWDLRGPVARALDGVQPDLLVFTKTEIWPVLVAEAKRRGVPVAIVGASVPDGAGRGRLLARLVLRDAWAAVDVACAISDIDAERLVSLGVDPGATRVTGDPGIDSAASRLAQADTDAPYLRPFVGSRRPTVVAGSTWPSDEEVLLPALRALRERVEKLCVVIAPHEPGADHVAGLLRRLRDDGWNATTLDDVEEVVSGDGSDTPSASYGEPVGAPTWNAVVVERVGVLAHLYRVATASYVGGGFHEDGLHSVLEPAAAASPVVFGPRHANARAAGELLEAGGAKLASSAPEMTEILGEWLGDPQARKDVGQRAHGYIVGHLGAADRTARYLEQLLTDR